MLPISTALKTRRAANSLCSEFVPLRKSVLGLQQTLMLDSAKTSSGSAEVPSLGGALPAEVFPSFSAHSNAERFFTSIEMSRNGVFPQIALAAEVVAG